MSTKRSRCTVWPTRCRSWRGRDACFSLSISFLWMRQRHHPETMSFSKECGSSVRHIVESSFAWCSGRIAERKKWLCPGPVHETAMLIPAFVKELSPLFRILLSTPQHHTARTQFFLRSPTANRAFQTLKAHSSPHFAYALVESFGREARTAGHTGGGGELAMKQADLDETVEFWPISTRRQMLGYPLKIDGSE